MGYKKTKQAYENYLNELSPDYCSEDWIIGGKDRKKNYYNRYGTALRKFDPIAFEVGYNEWEL